MAGVHRFEDLIAWQRARGLAACIYSLTTTTPLARDFTLRDQLRRSAVSIASNIAEGFGSSAPRSFLRYLRIAEASAAEVRSHLYIAFDTGLVSEGEFNELSSELGHVVRLLRGLSRSVNRKLRTEH
jgi:four helix bundle protein